MVTSLLTWNQIRTLTRPLIPLLRFQTAPYLVELYRHNRCCTRHINQIRLCQKDHDPIKRQRRSRTKKNYKLVYKVDENIRSIEDIRRFTNSVVVSKESVFPSQDLHLVGATDVVPKIQSAGLSVYVELFSNEFVSQAWDFFSDATVEINTYVMAANVSGIVSDFPFMAARYKSK